MNAPIEVRVGHHGDGAVLLAPGFLLGEADATVFGVDKDAMGHDRGP
jgi:hypothetical protein